MRIALHVAAMAIVGCLALLGVGLLFHARAVWDANALLAAEIAPSPVPASEEASPAAAHTAPVVRAMAEHLLAGADALDRGLPTRAAPRFDAALRLGRVLRDATGSQAIVSHVEHVRRALQNGRPRSAAAAARDGAAAIRGESLGEPRPVSALTGYAGAVVLNATGQRVGRVTGVRDDRLEVEQGGLQDVLGFLTLQHGVRRQLPRSRLLFGNRQRLGETIVIDTGAGH